MSFIKPDFYFSCVKSVEGKTVGIFFLRGKHFGQFYSKQVARITVDVIRDMFPEIPEVEVNLALGEIERSVLPEWDGNEITIEAGEIAEALNSFDDRNRIANKGEERKKVILTAEAAYYQPGSEKLQ